MVRSRGVDWSAVAGILSERQSAPAAIIDADGRFQLVNRSMEEVVGYSRFELLGSDWRGLLAPTDDGYDHETCVREALRGTLERGRVTLLTRSGDCLAVEVELTVIGAEAAASLMATFARYRLIATDHPGFGTSVGVYEITTTPTDFGRLRRVQLDGERRPIDPAGPRCHEFLYGRSSPCEDCPLQTDGTRTDGVEPAWPRTRVWALDGEGPGGEEAVHFRVVEAAPIDGGTAVVRVQSLSESALRGLRSARVEVLGRKAKLSGREGEVLKLLVEGRSVAQIARELDISERTVKFHQANVLDKLGAKSKADLVRFVC